MKGVVLLAVALIVVPGPAIAAEEPPGRVPVVDVRDGWESRVQQERAPRVTCQDPTVRMLARAGFTGPGLRMAYAIVMRESKGQNLDESSRWYTGALGVWQIQTSAHSGKPWWSRSAMLDPLTQSRIVYRYMSDRGRNWRPWGLTPDGRLDATNYGGWSSWQRENWIMAPFRKYYENYPC